MPSLLPRLRSLHRSTRSRGAQAGEASSSSVPTTPVSPISPLPPLIGIAQGRENDMDGDRMPYSPRTPIDSKIHPNPNALFDAVDMEQASERTAGDICETITSGDNDEEEFNDNELSRGHGKDWPTFGRDALSSNTDLQQQLRLHHSTEPFPDELRDNAIRTRKRTLSSTDSVSDIVEEEKRRRIMSWSPPMDDLPSPILPTIGDLAGLDGVESSSIALSSPTSFATPELPREPPSTFQSPPQGTFGRPTPYGSPSPAVTGSGSELPPLPFPAFQSTPRMASALRSVSMFEIPPTSSLPRMRQGPGIPLPSGSSTYGNRTRRTQSDRPPLSGVFAASPLNETGMRASVSSPSRGRTSSRPKSGAGLRQMSASVRSRDPRRRKSAEWNAQAAEQGLTSFAKASAGDTSQTTAEFGWQAEVAHEILRLSLGASSRSRQAAAGSSARPTARSAPSAVDHLPEKENMLRVSHAAKSKGARKTSRARLSSTPSRIPRPPLQPITPTASAQARSAQAPTAQTRLLLAKAHTRERRPQKTHARARSANALDTKFHDSYDRTNDGMSREAVTQPSSSGGKKMPAAHRRAASENRIEWDSREVQDFLDESAYDGVGTSFDLNAALQHSTPIKKNDSESTYETAGSSSYLHAPSLSVIAASPDASPGRSLRDLDEIQAPRMGKQVSDNPSERSKGKRKADETEDNTPPELLGIPLSPITSTRGRKTSFAASRPVRPSNVSQPPSSFQSYQSQAQSTKSRKRVRLSSPTPDAFGVLQQHPHLHPQNPSDSLSSRNTHASARSRSNSLALPSHSLSYTTRPGSSAARPQSRAMSGASSLAGRSSKRHSFSQSSQIPISAIISPHPPSIDRLSTFHMRDPQKPPPRRDVGWALRFASSEEQGSPVPAWCFWIGFVCPLLWWIASFWRVRETRTLPDTEKAVVVDDPHYEREARKWRLRCRIAGAVFFVTYLPVIILLAIFVPK